MDKKILITIVLLVLGLGIGLALDVGQSNTRPQWIHKVQWLGEQPDNAAKIEESLWLEVSPYKTEYDIVNITAKGETNGLHINVMANALDSDYPDIYDFVYDKDELLLTGYLLEAVPPIYRNEAIGIAINNMDVASSIQNSGTPSVKRILPKTSQKFYMPKTLLSVTWKGISALVDTDERKVVQVWKESANVNK